MIKFKRSKYYIFKLFFTLTIIFFSLLTNAQAYLDFKNVDKKTYDFYENQDWDSLITIGKEAQKNNLDYFYLRARLGMAYYQKQNYIKAVKNFEKALQFNSTDVFALEYLYYSYLFLNREQDAKLLSTKFPESLKSKLNITKEKSLNNIYFETGYIFSNNISKNGNINLFGNDSIYGEQDLNSSIFYAHAGLSKSIGKKFSLYFGFSNLNIDKEKQIQYRENMLNRDSTVKFDWGYENYYSNDTIYKYISDKYKLHQNELYINSSIQFNKGFKITPAFHFINVKYSSPYANYIAQNFTDTAYYTLFDDTYYLFDSINEIYTINTETTSINNYVISLSITKNVSYFSFDLFGTYSNLNDKKQTQIGLSIAYYPFGNINFYGVTTIKGFYEEESKNNKNKGKQKKNNRLILNQTVGLKVLPKVWFEGFITYGDLSNTSEKNAFIFYNIPDKINYKWGANLILSVFKNIELSLRYNFLSKESYYITYYFDEENNNTDFKTVYTQYKNQSIIGGIKWKF